MHVHPSADSRRCIVPGFLNLCLVELVLSADPARAVYVQSPMHGVHTWPKVLVWTPETSERDTGVGGEGGFNNQERRDEQGAGVWHALAIKRGEV